ncbi:MAG: sensor histidine kinase, partial [Chloroflexota bacterium]|nr:sensor histidine kinase [Chloroflexota bacterium]
PPVLRVASGRGLTRPDMSKKVPGLKGILGKAIESGAPQLTHNISQDPELTHFWAFRTCKAGYCIPLRVDLETFGVLLFAHSEENYFASEQREILNVVSRQAMIALQNAQLFQKLKAEKEHIVKVQDEARMKLARDLHDGPTQAVAAIAMQASLATKLLKKNPAQAEKELQLIEDTARRTTKEIRHMLFTLRPLVLESEGLVAALDAMAEKMNETYNQNVIVEADENVIYDLEMNSQTVIFTIAEEAVNNARKHAKAKHIWVRVQRARNVFAVLEVEDDGAGFDVKGVFDEYDQRGSLGMVNMKERAALARGIFHVESNPGKGAKIEVVIPLTDDAADRIRKFQ